MVSKLEKLWNQQRKGKRTRGTGERRSGRASALLCFVFLAGTHLLASAPTASASHAPVCLAGHLPVLCPPHPCEDGVDNDGDGWTDYPNDTGCASLDDDEAGNPACSDGFDTDGDGRTDYPADPGCDGIHDSSECNVWAYDGGAVIVSSYGTSVQVYVWWRADGYSCPGGILVTRTDSHICGPTYGGSGWHELYCMSVDPPMAGGTEGAWECRSSVCAGKPSPHGLRAEFHPRERPPGQEQFECLFYKSTNIPDSALDWGCQAGQPAPA